MFFENSIFATKTAGKSILVPQGPAKSAQERPKPDQDAPQSAQTSPRIAQDDKIASRDPQDAPKTPQNTLRFRWGIILIQNP